MIKSIIALFIIICAFPQLGSAQINLVRNGGFEKHDTCPDFYDQIRRASFWDGIDTNYIYGDSAYNAGYKNCLPDYMNVCDTYGLCRVPNNPYFHHFPRNGKGMVQNIMYYDLYAIYTTGYYSYNYTQGRLHTNLIAGKNYCVTFHVLKEPISQYSNNNIGAYLDDGTIDTVSSFLNAAKPQIQYTPQILETAIISDTTNWTRIQGNFVANGSEKFITIGVFFDTAHTVHIADGVNITHVGAYLIDDVSVIASDAVAYAGHDTTSMHAGDTVRLGSGINGDGMPCWWYKLGVTSAIDSGGTIYVHPDSTTTYVVMMDLCGTITYDTVTVFVGPSGVATSPFPSKGGVTCYPNPARDEVTVDGAKGCAIGIYDVLGRRVLTSECGERSVVLDISGLTPGIYSLQITDMATGSKVVQKLVKL